jgi:hypothetical protein
MRRFSRIGLVFLALTVPLLFAASASSAGEPRLWIAELGSAKYAVREAATRNLDKLGEAALPALQAALAHAETPLEVRMRAANLVERIETRAAITSAIAGRKLHLKLDNQPVNSALKHLGALSACSFSMADPTSILAQRRITLDTGEVDFWQAFDRLCEHAGICEADAVQANAAAGDAGGNVSIGGFGGFAEHPLAPEFPLFRVMAPVAALKKRAVLAPTCYQGAFRVRAADADAKTRLPGEPATAGFILEISPAPALAWKGANLVRIRGAWDEHGNRLDVVATPRNEVADDPLLGGPPVDLGRLGSRVMPPAPKSNQVTVAFTAGNLAPTLLKKVEGTITIDVFVMRRAFTIPDVAAAAGKQFAVGDGGFITVAGVERKPRALELEIREKPDRQAQQSGHAPRLARTRDGTLYVLTPDAGASARFSVKPSNLPAVQPATSSQSLVPGLGSNLDSLWSLSYEVHASAQGPLALVFTTPRLTAVEVPFTLHDVPLTPNPRLAGFVAGGVPIEVK